MKFMTVHDAYVRACSLSEECGKLHDFIMRTVAERMRPYATEVQLSGDVMYISTYNCVMELPAGSYLFEGTGHIEYGDLVHAWLYGILSRYDRKDMDSLLSGILKYDEGRHIRDFRFTPKSCKYSKGPCFTVTFRDSDRRYQVSLHRFIDMFMDIDRHAHLVTDFMKEPSDDLIKDFQYTVIHMRDTHGWKPKANDCVFVCRPVSGFDPIWHISVFSHMDMSYYERRPYGAYRCIDGTYEECVPFNDDTVRPAYTNLSDDLTILHI